MPQGEDGFVSPWSVEYLPNPVIFSTATVLYAGYNAIRVALETYDATKGAEKGEDQSLNESVDMDKRCAECGVAFATKGLLRRHIYRKHVRRFACELCKSSFNLKKDLERHEQTVHRAQLEARPGYVCPNSYCISPQTVFARKDNFDRHVKRCAKRHGRTAMVSVRGGKLAPQMAGGDASVVM